MTLGRLSPACLILLAGCTSQTPKPQAPAAERRVETPSPTPANAPAAESHPIALLEPYLMPVAPVKAIIPPPSLRGGIVPRFDPAPLSPVPPTQVVPIEPVPQTPKTAPSPPPASPPASKPVPNLDRIVSVVSRLLSAERQRAVDLARSRKAAADARATQTSEQAKKISALVRAGALAQHQSDDAEKAARDAADEQAAATKAVADAEGRLASVHSDVEAALRAVAIADGFELAQVPVVPQTWTPMPGTYRLSLLGGDPKSIAVEGGTLGHPLSLAPGETGAWILRSATPQKVKVRLGKEEAKLFLRPGPERPASRPVL